MPPFPTALSLICVVPHLAKCYKYAACSAAKKEKGFAYRDAFSFLLGDVAGGDGDVAGLAHC